MPWRRIEVSTSTSTRGSRSLSAMASRSASRDTVVITRGSVRSCPGRLVGGVPRLQDHHVAGEVGLDQRHLRGHAHTDRVRPQLGRRLGQPGPSEAVAVALDHRDQARGGPGDHVQMLPPTLRVEPQPYPTHPVHRRFM